MNILRQLARTSEPRVHAATVPLSEQDVPPGHVLIRLDGAKMTRLDSLYNEFVHAFKFPEYFGRNYNALSECLSDLNWLPADGYVIEIQNSNCLLMNEPDDVLDGFLDILHRVSGNWAEPVTEGEPWDRSARPFHVVLVADSETSFESQRSGTSVGNVDSGSPKAN